jgi:hypothetical protein
MVSHSWLFLGRPREVILVPVTTGLTLKAVYATGYAVVALTFVSSIGLAML